MTSVFAQKTPYQGEQPIRKLRVYSTIKQLQHLEANYAQQCAWTIHHQALATTEKRTSHEAPLPQKQQQQQQQ
jgi:hypothetical protein